MRTKKQRKPLELTCMDCGQKFETLSAHAKRCVECRKKWDRERPARKKKKCKCETIEPKMSIGEVLKELKKYNEENGTCLNYGQYISMCEGAKK